MIIAGLKIKSNSINLDINNHNADSETSSTPNNRPCGGNEESEKESTQDAKERMRIFDVYHGVFVCKLCSFKANYRNKFKKHMKRHSNGDVIISCTDCDFKTLPHLLYSLDLASARESDLAATMTSSWLLTAF